MRSIKIILAMGIMVVFAVCLAFAAPPENHTGIDFEDQSGITSIDNTTYIDANRILMFVTNHGNIGRDLTDYFGYDYGTFYPYVSTDLIQNGTNISSPLYTAGIWMGGRVNGEIRIALSEYSSEFVPGPMLGGTYQTDRPEFRVYKLYHDSLAASPNNDYVEYMNYAVAQGSPLDSLGQPVVHGDQTTWTVYNDADPHQHVNNSGETDPLGIEVRQSVWASFENGDDESVIPEKFAITQLGGTDFSVAAFGTSTDVPDNNDYMVIASYDPVTGPNWNLTNLTTGIVELSDQIEPSILTSDGIYVRVDIKRQLKWEYISASPSNLSPVAVSEDPSYTGGRWFTGGDHGGDAFFGGVFLGPNFRLGTNVAEADITPIEIRFRPMNSYTDLNGDGTYTIGEPFEVDNPLLTQNAFMYRMLEGASYEGFYPVPFTAWDISDTLNPRQVNVVVRDRDENLAWDLNVRHDAAEVDLTNLPNYGDLRLNYVWIQITDYDSTGTYYGDGSGSTIDFWNFEYGGEVVDAMWTFWFDDAGNGGMLAEESIFKVSPEEISRVDTFLFTSTIPEVTLVGPDASALYIEYKLYNKANNVIEDFYVSFWSDPDLGGMRDDLVGCDTLQDIFFCYNAVETDQHYAIPPAIGFKVLKGPLVPSPGDTAYFAGNLVPGFRNLGMTSFNKYINGTDPDDYVETFNYMQGLGKLGSPLPNGTKFAVPGDPATGTGDLDIAPSDRRMMASFGPVNFNPGDSQYVLIKMAVGQGYNRLQSITAMKDILNHIPTDDPVDPHQFMSMLLPDTQYVLFVNAIEPILNTLIIGRTGEDIEDIDVSSLRINDGLEPVSTEYLDSFDGFGGRVLRIIFNGSEFVAGYGPAWDIRQESFTLSGSFSDGSPLNESIAFVLRGHRSGDANADGHINIADVIHIINYIFRAGEAPDPIQLGDANIDDRVNIGDAIFLVNYIFKDGPPPGK